MNLMKHNVVWIAILILISLNLSQTSGHGGSDDGDDGEGSGTNTGGTKGLTLVKIWCLIILLFGTFAGGMSPYFYRWNESFLLLGTQFAGGVFLGTSMMHFLSDSNSTFGNLTTKEYPFAFMLACFGYLLTMFGDCVISYATRNHASNAPNSRSVQAVDATPSPSEEEKQQRAGHVEMDSSSTPVLLKTSSFGDTILLIVALCFHSIFEGIAVGVSDTKAEAWRNLWTIGLHKIFAAIAMGIALLRMLPDRPFLTSVAYSFAFAVSSPIGIGIGIAATQGKSSDWIYAISMGVACGVFIYVAINHLIATGFKPSTKSYFDTQFFKFLAVTFGVGVIAVVMIWD